MIQTFKSNGEHDTTALLLPGDDVLHIPLVCLDKALFEGDLGLPPNSLYLGAIHELPRRAVRLARVPHQLPLEPNHLLDQLGKLLDGHLTSTSHIYMLKP